MFDKIIYLTFVMYSLNMNIFIMMKTDFDNAKKNSFFNMLTHYKIDTYKFMKTYQSIMYKSSFFFILIGMIMLIRG